MPISISGKLEKLQIRVYETVDRKRSIGDPFEVMFNPSSIKTQHQHVYKETPVLGGSAPDVGFAYTQAQEIQLDLVIDGTGVADIGLRRRLGKTKSVASQVKDFLDLCFHRDGNIHEPKFLRLSWGEGPLKSFDSRLASVDIEYTTFEKDGSPLRAVLKTNFMEDFDSIKKAAIERSSSPDLTHTRIVRSGDTLPLLSKEIYGSPEYYLQLAEVNNLNDFRKLEPGIELYFPPLEN